MSRLHFACRISLATTLAVASSVSCASSLNILVTDANGQELADAVVYAEPLSVKALPIVNQLVEIEQSRRKFIPLVTVVQTGTEILFPNNDKVRHHVYSFSAAKTFDIKLFSGVHGSPVMFDKPGTIVVGCNIHDQMLAYIHVVSTPYFAKTGADGKARLGGMAAGNYTLKAWHYATPSGAPLAEQSVSIAATEAVATFKLSVKNSAIAK